MINVFASKRSDTTEEVFKALQHNMKQAAPDRVTYSAEIAEALEHIYVAAKLLDESGDVAGAEVVTNVLASFTKG